MICFAQFFAWIGWFPFNFFCSEYIKDLSLAEHDGDVDAAVRAGNLALLLFSCVSIATAICVPPVLAAIRRRRSNNDNSSRSPLLPIVWATSHLLFAGIMVAFVFTRSAQQSIILVSVVGICWAIATWVPFTLIGEYVATQQLNNHDACDSLSDYERKGDNGKDIGGDEDEDEEILAFSDCDSVGINQPQASYGTLESQQRSSIGTGSSAPSSDRRRSAANCAAGGETGVLLGIHNFFVVLPQFFATGLSSVIFELTSGRPESEAISWMWCIGGFCSILASLIAYSIQ
jgi:solute carrier family 45 protein 1/2/4